MKPENFPEIVTTYLARGNMQQYRFAAATAFTCSRCTREKKAKLITTLDDDWERLLCNGCYGKLLSDANGGGKAGSKGKQESVESAVSES